MSVGWVFSGVLRVQEDSGENMPQFWGAMIYLNIGFCDVLHRWHAATRLILKPSAQQNSYRKVVSTNQMRVNRLKF